jgi:ParB family chromosome partitioning protein
MEECQLTHEALSDRVGKDRSTVTNYVRLLKLPPDVQAALKDGRISMGHARALAGIEHIARQKQIFQRCLEQHLSVRALENLIKSESQVSVANKTAKKTGHQNAEITKIQSGLSHSLGTPVQIKRSEQGSGQIVIPFKNDREFNLLIEKLISENS